MRRTFYKLFTCLLFFMYSSYELCAIPSITRLREVRGSCVSDCGIIVEATNLGVNVRYGLLDYPIPGQNRTQTENTFNNLEPGTYTVAVYDNTTGDRPVTQTITIATTYIEMQLKTPVVGNNQNNSCVDNGSINISLSGGKYPYRYKIVGPVTREVVDVYSSAHIFTDLPSGDYSVEVEDACGQWRRSKPGEPVTVTSYVDPINEAVFQSVTIAQADLNSNTYGIKDVCDAVSVKFHSSDVVITSDNSSRVNSSNRRLKYYFESPAGSGNWSTAPLSFENGYLQLNNIPYTKGDSYRIKVVHPCTGAETVSNALAFPPEPSKFRTNYNNNDRIYTDFCHSTENPYVTVRINDTGKEIRGYGCGDYTFVLKKKDDGTILDTRVGPSEIVYTGEHGLTGGVAYVVEISKGDVTYPAVNFTVPMVSKEKEPTTDYIYFDDYYAKANNFGTSCDFDHTKPYAKLSHSSTALNEKTVKYSMVEPAAYQSVFLPIELKRGGSLWDNLPYGTYTIREEYEGCPPKDTVVTFTKKLASFEVDEFTYTEDPSFCGTYMIQAKGYFREVDGKVFEKVAYSSYLSYIMQIIEGPKKGKSNGVMPFPTSSPVQIGNLPGGSYKVIFYLSETPTVSGIPVCWYLEKTIDIPYYQLPKLNTPMSGGVSCDVSGGRAKLTMTADGTNGPFLYRYKVKGADDNTYTPADFNPQNVYDDLFAGEYTVQIMDRCGNIGTQDITIYNSGDQLIEVTDDSNGGGNLKVCRGQPLTLQVKSIGPVASYQWFKSDTGLDNSWTQLTDAAQHYSYKIPNVRPEDKGYYKVVIDNTSCIISSTLQIAEIEEPAKTPIIKGPVKVCPNTPFTLEAETDVDSPVFIWYRDGIIDKDATAATYTTDLLGDYTVVVVPQQGCVSDQSLVHSVIADPAVCAVANDDELIMNTCDGAQLVDVLANDITGGCTDIAIKVAPKNGSAQIVSDGGVNKIKYTPNPTFTGKDELTYEIVCSADVKVAAKLKIYVNSQIMVETISDAHEAGIVGLFHVRFTCPGVKYHKTLRVKYTLKGSAIPGVDYVEPSGIVDLMKGETGVNIPIVAKKNFLVQGNRDVKLEIVSVQEMEEPN